MMQRHFPRNLSRIFIPVTNAVVVDKADNARCEKPYPEGGPRGGRGSTSVDRGAMMVNAAKARSGRLTNGIWSRAPTPQIAVHPI
jgi:hypothetical protein